MPSESIVVEEPATETHRRRHKAKPASEEPLEHPAPRPRRTLKEQHSEETKPSPVNFFQRVARMSEGDWDHFKIYLYRRWPRISKSGEPHYIAVYRDAIDEEFIKSVHGSGRYKLQLNDPKHTVAETGIEIMDLNAPPRLSVDTLMDCPENAKYHKLWPSNPATARSADSMAAPDGTAAAAVKGLSDVAKTLLENAAKKGDTPSSTVADLLRELKPYLMNPTPAAAPAQPSVLEILTQVKQLQGDPLAMLEKAQKLVSRDQEKPDARPSAIDELKGMLEVVSQVQALTKPEPAVTAPVAAAPDAELWEKLSLIIGNQLSGILASVPGIISAWKGGPVPPPPAVVLPAPPPKTGAFNPYDQAAMRDFMRTQATAAAARPAGPIGSAIPMPPVTPPEQTAEASGVNGAAAPPADQGMLGDVAVLINQSLSCLNRGVDGRRYAGAMIDMNGDLAFDAIVEQIKAVGVPTVIQMAKSVPQVRQQVIAYEAPLQRFIEEFTEGPLWEDESEDDNAERGKHKHTATVA
jgi:hypothetical protein